MNKHVYPVETRRKQVMPETRWALEYVRYWKVDALAEPEDFYSKRILALCAALEDLAGERAQLQYDILFKIGKWQEGCPCTCSYCKSLQKFYERTAAILGDGPPHEHYIGGVDFIESGEP